MGLCETAYNNWVAFYPSRLETLNLPYGIETIAGMALIANEFVAIHPEAEPTIEVIIMGYKQFKKQ